MNKFLATELFSATEFLRLYETLKQGGVLTEADRRTHRIFSHQKPQPSSTAQHPRTDPRQIKQGENNPFYWLPNEMIVMILDLLPTRDLCNFAQTSFRFSILSADDRIWRDHFNSMVGRPWKLFEDIPWKTAMHQWKSHGLLGLYIASINRFTTPNFAPNVVAVTVKNEIVAADSNSCEIQVLKSDGTLLYCWGSIGFLPGQFLSITSITSIRHEIFICDAFCQRISSFTVSGTFLRIVCDTLEQPTHLAVDYDNLCVANGNSVVQMDCSGRIWNTIGKRRDGPVLNEVKGVGLARFPHRVYVADEEGVKVFSDSGKYLHTISGHADSIGVSPRGHVAMSSNFGIGLFTGSGKKLARFDSFAASGSMAFTRDGKLVVCDQAGKQLLIFA